MHTGKRTARSIFWATHQPATKRCRGLPKFCNSSQHVLSVLSSPSGARLLAICISKTLPVVCIIILGCKPHEGRDKVLLLTPGSRHPACADTHPSAGGREGWRWTPVAPSPSPPGRLAFSEGASAVSRVVALGRGSCHSLGAAPEAGGILTVPVPSLAFRGRLDVLQCLGPSIQKGPCLFNRKA